MDIIHLYRDVDELITSAELTPKTDGKWFTLEVSNAPEGPKVGSFTSSVKTVTKASGFFTHIDQLNLCPVHNTMSVQLSYDTDVSPLHHPVQRAHHVHGVVELDTEIISEPVEAHQSNISIQLPGKQKLRMSFTAVISDYGFLSDLIKRHLYGNKREGSFTTLCTCGDYLIKKANAAKAAGVSGHMTLGELFMKDKDIYHLISAHTSALNGWGSVSQGPHETLVKPDGVKWPKSKPTNEWMSTGYFPEDHEMSSLKSTSPAEAAPTPAASADKAFSQQAHRLKKLIPDMNRTVVCPTAITTSEIGECGNRSVFDMIMHLNDTHRWTRARVAEWMDELVAKKGWCFDFPTPDEIKKSGKPTLE